MIKRVFLQKKKVARMSLWFRSGCLSACAAVGLGAFGAHALKAKINDDKMLKTWEVAVHYHFIHSLALLASNYAFFLIRLIELVV
jgi:uncharacterized membrane protein YgdD (TMEM256/DUF423 family)